MTFYGNLEERVKNLTLFDLKLIKLYVFFVTLIIVKLAPQLMNINIWWFIVFAVIFAAKPFYVFWCKKLN